MSDGGTVILTDKRHSLFLKKGVRVHKNATNVSVFFPIDASI